MPLLQQLQQQALHQVEAALGVDLDGDGKVGGRPPHAAGQAGFAGGPVMPPPGGVPPAPAAPHAAHGGVTMSGSSAHKCDACRQSVTSGTIYRCRECDYDKCAQCAAQGSSAACRRGHALGPMRVGAAAHAQHNHHAQPQQPQQPHHHHHQPPQQQPGGAQGGGATMSGSSAHNCDACGRKGITEGTIYRCR
eukprot:gene255-4526_t